MTSAPSKTCHVVAAHALSATATTITTPLLVAGVFTATHSTTALAAANAVRMLPFVLLGAAAGRLVDRADHRHVLVASAAARAGLALLVTTATVVHGALLLLTALTVATAVAATPAYAAAGAAVATLASGAARQRAMTQLTSVETAAWVAGPAAGGLLLACAPTWTIPLAATLASTAAVALLTRLQLPARTGAPVPDQPTSVRKLLHTTVAPCAAALSVNIAIDATAAVLILLHGTRSDYGLLLSALGTGAALTLLAAPLTRTRHLPYYLAVSAAALLTAAHTSWTPGRAALLAVAGAAAVAAEAAATVALQQRVQPTLHGTALGALDQVVVGGALAGTVGGPLAAHLLGPTTTLTAAALLLTPVLLLRPGPPNAARRRAEPALPPVPAARR